MTLKLTSVSFNYGELKALNAVSFSFDEPGMLGLFGHNASGKSTLLNILMGFLPCQKGEVEMFSSFALGNDQKIKKPLRLRLGILPQGFSTDEKLSVAENFYFYGSLMGLDKKTLARRIEFLLNEADLLKEKNIPLKKLSGGTRRRVELYRTFIHEPKLLLLDEPSVGLDIAHQEKFISFAHNYALSHSAYIAFASHNLDDFRLVNKVAFLHNGQLVGFDAPQCFLSKYAKARVDVELNQELADHWLQKTKTLFHWQSENPERQAFSSWLPEDGLSGSHFDHKAVKSFFVRKANLKDAYGELMQEANK